MINSDSTKAYQIEAIDVTGQSPCYNPSGSYRFTLRGIGFIIGRAEGFNAMGLIGTEANGVFLLNIDQKNIVFTEHMRQGMGNQYKAQQEAEVHRLLNLPENELVSFIQNMSRTLLRYDPFKVTVTPKKLTATLLARWTDLATNYYDWHNDEVKAEFLMLGRLIARTIAKAMKFTKDQYTIRISKGGPAVSGEVYLDSKIGTLGPDGLYVNLGQSGVVGQFMARATCGNLSGANCWFRLEELKDMPALAKRLRRCPPVTRTVKEPHLSVVR